MNLSTASRTLQLLGRVADVRTATEPFLAPEGDKPALPLRPAQQPFPRVSPEEEGVSSRHLKKFLEELAAGRDLYMQDVMVLRHGKVLCEAAFGGQDLRCPKYTFSACKSVTSLAVGLLVDDGLLSLDEKVVDIFDDIAPQATKRRLKNLSVEHLLTMRSSVVFSEPEALTEEDWPRRFLGSAQKGEPGAEFAYNSLNTYMLSAIIRRKTGRGMTELLQERLFEPMGITDTLWEKCPQGIEKGGWGLYIRPEDMAKLGQLVLNGGQWQGRQLISRAYLDAAVTAHAFPPHTIGDYDYGYQIWVGRHERSFLFNGMLGQNVLGYPDSGILVVTNAGADTDFQESRYFEIVSRYFGGSFPDALPEDPQAREELEAAARSLSWYSRPGQGLTEAAGPFLNRCFTVRDDKAPSTGLLPLALQALHNSYTGGVEAVSVSVRDGLPELIYREKDALHRLCVGLGRPRVSALTFGGCSYQVAALGRFTHDEEERPVFYIRLEFLETPCVRVLKLVIDGDQVLLKQTETPGVPYLLRKLRRAAEQPLSKPLLLMALGGAEDDFLLYKTEQIMSPQLHMEI